MSRESPGDRLAAAARRLVGASAGEQFLLSLLAIVLAVVVSGVFVFVVGYFASCSSPAITTSIGSFCYDPISVYYYMITGAFGSYSNLLQTLSATTVLLLAGLSVAIAFKADLFNIGTQGQIVLGGLVSAVVVSDLAAAVSPGPLTGTVLVVIGIVAGVLTGAVYGAIPGIMKAYAGANEVITTIMLNFVADGLAFTYVKTFISGNSQVQTEPIPSWAQLSPVIAPSTSSFSYLALVGALLIAVGIYYLLNYSAFGYNIRVSGLQPKAALYSGVDSKRVIVSTMTLSGALGGLAGAVYVLMSLGYWVPGIPSYGFDGITVSVLAMNNPIGAIPAALLFGVLRAGSLSLTFNTSVPKELAGALRGFIIFFIAVPGFIRLLIDTDRISLGRSEESSPEDQP